MKTLGAALFLLLLITVYADGEEIAAESSSMSLPQLWPSSSPVGEAPSLSLSSLLKPFMMGFTGRKALFETIKKFIDPLQPDEHKVITKFGPIATSIISSDAIESLVSTVLTIPKQCGGPVRGYVDDKLGDFRTTQHSPYCDSNCGRNVLCCGPTRRDEIGVNFVYSNGIEPAHFVKEGDESFYRDVHELQKPLLFYVNGVIENYTVFGYMNETRDGLLSNGYSVILVDWSFAKFEPVQLNADSRVVGAMIGSMIKWLDWPHLTTCMGLSTGAHTCGEAGKWLKERDITLAKCIGLDAAGPLYDKCSPDVTLDRSDCGVVVGVHTSGFASPLTLLEGRLGTRHKFGHCDFYLNSAIIQPNCYNVSALNVLNNLLTGRIGKFDYDLEFAIFCSHVRAELYLRSQVHRWCKFTGWRVHKCDHREGCEILDPRLIPSDDPAPTLMMLPPFDECTSDMRADYQITTTGTEPFC